jgi:hypothetical protein
VPHTNFVDISPINAVSSLSFHLNRVEDGKDDSLSVAHLGRLDKPEVEEN